MKFYAKCSNGAMVVTDDYDEEEIKLGKHIENILEDFRRHFFGDLRVIIYNENNKVVFRGHLYTT